jgi:acetyl esterase/lipase
MQTRLIDGEIEAAFLSLVEARGHLSPPARGDWKALRELGEQVWPEFAAQVPARDEVKTMTYSTPSEDGVPIALRWYENPGQGPGSAVVYAHGGGMIALDIDAYDLVVREYVAKSGVPFLAVDYRLAPEVRGPTPAEDVFAGIRWLAERAAELGVDPKRIAVIGDCGGGGVAAGAAILARNRRLPLASQLLIYPMLDDRNLTPDPTLEPWAFWTYDNNFTAWKAVLGEAIGAAAVSPVAAPGRLTDFDGLAPAYVEVGDLDIFRDESITYALSIARAGAPVELHVHAGAPHGYDRFAPGSALTRRAMSDRIRVIGSF